MTNELEKQFFDTFGIEKKQRKACVDENTLCPTPEKECEECSYYQYIHEYQQITDRILLELICILADLYNSNSHGYPLLSKDIKELKEDVLDDLMGAIDVANDYPEGYANKVRTLFEEG